MSWRGCEGDCTTSSAATSVPRPRYHHTTKLSAQQHLTANIPPWRERVHRPPLSQRRCLMGPCLCMWGADRASEGGVLLLGGCAGGLRAGPGLHHVAQRARDGHTGLPMGGTTHQRRRAIGQGSLIEDEGSRSRGRRGQEDLPTVAKLGIRAYTLLP